METSSAGSEDMWTPFKELEKSIKASIYSEDATVLDKLEKTLQKFKQNFLTILKNPPKNTKSREELLKGIKDGIRLPGIGHQLLQKELVDEAIIISDMYDLNEYMSLELLATAQHQLPYYPGLTRGLVAVLLYYDGRRALVSSLRMLVQARNGIRWAVEGSKQIAEYITNYTTELMKDGLILKILNILVSLDLSKEMEILQVNRALGGPRHHHQVVDLYQNIRQNLADIIYLWAAQSGLPKDPTIELIKVLQQTTIQEDSSGGIDSVTLTLQMGLLYAIDMSVLHRVENGDEVAESLPLLSESEFIPKLQKEISPSKTWKCKGLQGLTYLAWTTTLATLRTAPACLNVKGLLRDDDDYLVNAAMECKVFSFLTNCFLLNESIYKEEFFLRKLHTLLADFIVFMPLKVKELRIKADEAARTINANMQEGLEPPTNLPSHFENLLLTIAKLYSIDPLDLQLEMDYWCPVDGIPASSRPYRSFSHQVSLNKFVRKNGDVLPPSLFVPYMNMLSSLASCKDGAAHAFYFLKENQQSTATWDHFFNSLNRYYINLRQELPPIKDTIYRQRNFPKGITPQEIQGLRAVLGIIRTVAEHNATCRLALCENPAWAPLSLLPGLVTCSVQINLKAEMLLTLAALAKSPDTAAILWHNLEASQILATVPSTSSFQHRGIETELEELESRNEEFPLTRAMLHLLDVLTDVPVPRLLGVGSRPPGFDPYLKYIINSVLLKFHTRSYKNQQEKWEVCRICLHLLVKYLTQYEPQRDDFGTVVVQVQGDITSVISPPPGFQVMIQLCTKSELFRLILLLIDEGCQIFDTYTVFNGKTTLEAATLLCLQLLEAALNLQQRFLATHSAANSDLLLIGVNKLLNGNNPRTGKHDHLLNITKFVTYNSWLPSHALSAVNILKAVTFSPMHHSHLLSVFTSTSSLTTQIRHGFIECLEADDEEMFAEGDNLSVVSRTKEVICKLLLQCLNYTTPNITHYLLGFDLNKDLKKTVFQQPGVLGFPRTCLHSILDMLSSSLCSRIDMTSPTVSHWLVELGYRLVYALAANTRTSEPTLRFLRSSGYFLQRHLAALPFRSNNPDSDRIQTSWLLKTVAIELKVTSTKQQLSQLTALVKLLVAHTPSDEEPSESTHDSSFNQIFSSQIGYNIGSESDTHTVRKRLIFLLLKDLPFLIEDVPQPVWKFFLPTKIEQVLRQCDSYSSAGIKVIDVKRLHRILKDELSAIQGSSTAGQRSHILEEIQNVLEFAVKQNAQRRKAMISVQYLDAWRQTTEIMFAVAPSECVSFPLRFSLLLELVNELLIKVLAYSVLKDIALLTSDAILMFFVNLRNCFTFEHNRIMSQEKVGSLDAKEAVNFSSLLEAKENVLKNIMTSILKWILSSVPSQKLRANLYASLLNFLRLSRQQCEQPTDINIIAKTNSYVSLLDDKKSVLRPQWVSKHSSLEVLKGFGRRLVTVMCQDFSGGHDICKMLALSCLDMMVELDPSHLWISFLSARGYLKCLIDSLLDSDLQLIQVLAPMPKSLRPVYVYEAKMALLCRVAASQIGAELLLEQNCLSRLSAMQVFENHPDIVPTIPGQDELMDFVPCVSSIYLQIMSPALTLCETILSSLGVENESAVVQVIHFLLSHGDPVSQVLRSGSPMLKLSYLKELAQLTGVIARATNQSIVKKINKECSDAGSLLESTSHFQRIQRLMLSLLSRFIITESLIKDVLSNNNIDISDSKSKADATLCITQIAANLVLYVRNLVASGGLDKRVTNVILQPSLLDAVVTDRREIGLNQEPSLGVVVKQLDQCVNHYHREKAALDLLLRKYSSIPDMNSVNIKEFLPEDFNRLSALDECKQRAAKIIKLDIENKNQEVDLYCFIIEHCLYLLWSHLDYYMFRAIPNKTLGISKSSRSAQTFQMAEITWDVTIEEINVLKQGLMTKFDDTFCKHLIGTTQDQKPINKGFVEALLRRIKKLMQFVPIK